jgi:hypothetical protein
MSNPKMDCGGQYHFYNKFRSVAFDFIVYHTPLLVNFKPKVDIRLPGGDTVIVNIPAQEQLKLPDGVDIDVLMTLHWTSREFADEIETREKVLEEGRRTVF